MESSGPKFVWNIVLMTGREKNAFTWRASLRPDFSQMLRSVGSFDDIQARHSACSPRTTDSAYSCAAAVVNTGLYASCTRAFGAAAPLLSPKGAGGGARSSGQQRAISRGTSRRGMMMFMWNVVGEGESSRGVPGAKASLVFGGCWNR